MAGNGISSIRPGDVDVAVAARAARRIRDYLANHPNDDLMDVLGETGEDAPVVPRPAVAMLAQVLSLLAKGEGVQIMPARAMITTQQAADALNVSRPYLIKLLEAQEIPYQMVGTHRRIAFADLLDYKRRDDQRRRAVLDQLAELSEELDED
jgi:excisionase family DNA binding protein